MSSSWLLSNGEDYFDFSIREKISQYQDTMKLIDECVEIEDAMERIKTIYTLRWFAKSLIESLEKANMLFQSSVKWIAIDSPKTAFNNDETKLL